MHDIEIRFSPRQKLPPGYRVVWSPETEHYHAETLDGNWDSDVFCCRFDARRCAFNHFTKASKPKDIAK